MHNSPNNYDFTLAIKGGHFTDCIVDVKLWDDVSSVRAKCAAAIEDRVPSGYRRFEYYNSAISPDSVKLLYAGKQLEDGRRLEEYGINKDNYTLHSSLRYGTRDLSIQMVCIANNIRFTTFIDYNIWGLYTIAQIKAQLLQYTGLTCTALYLKERGVDEFCKLEDDDTILLKDIYAILDGELKEPGSLGLYEAKNEGHDEALFSKPKPESIERLSIVQRKSLISCNPPTFSYNFSNIILYATFGAGSVLFKQCIVPMLRVTAHRAPYSEVACLSILGAVISTIIGAVSNCLYERYFKSQDTMHAQSNACNK